MKKDMRKEIEKYQGNIFYFDINKKEIFPAYIYSLKDYNHYEFELHHVVPFTDWENNTKNVQSKADNALILLPKLMHQHLENPIYKLTKEDFERLYGINPDAILYDVNSRLGRTCELFNKTIPIKLGGIPLSPTFLSPVNLIDENDLSCFDEIYSEVQYA